MSSAICVKVHRRQHMRRLWGGTWTVIDKIIIPNAHGSLLESRSEAADSVPTARQRPWRAQKETGGKSLIMRARDRTELIC